MTIEEMQNGYKKEVNYQKHMLRNLGYWFQLFLTISAIGLVLIYYFHTSMLFFFIVLQEDIRYSRNLRKSKKMLAFSADSC